MEESDFQQHIVYKVILSHSTPTQAFDAFAKYVWWGGGGFGAAGVVNLGDKKTLEGSVRSVPLGIHEAATKVKYPSSFEYTLVRKSIFPVSAHRGEITFRKVEGDSTSTEVVWNIHYTPYMCLNWFARSMISFLPLQLSSLKSSFERDNKSGSKSD